MIIINEHRLMGFAKRHADAKKAFLAWRQITQEAAWQSLLDVWKVYPSADGVEVRKEVVATVFNIRGNRYRLITIIIYAAQIVDIVEVLSHAEYSKDSWKRRI